MNLTIHRHLLQSFRNNGAMHPLTHVPSWSAVQHLELYFSPPVTMIIQGFDYQGNSDIVFFWQLKQILHD
jgi:hypothetical protein